MGAILFGSISTIADTSELQRQAFNAAFAEHGLSWSWDREEYVGMLERSGGSNRVAEYAEARGEDVDAAEVHATKTRIFQERLRSDGVTVRPGVAETISAAHDRGLRVALVTTTVPGNVQALLAALGEAGEGAVGAGSFDLVTDASAVEQSKPSPAIYTHTLANLGEEASSCVAVEDNVEGVRAARAAGLRCVAFPNENTAGHDFAEADQQVTTLDIDDLTALTTTA